MFSASVTHEQRQAEREGNQRLRRVELEVAGELADDLDGDGRHRIEHIEGQVGGDAGRQHHDHGLADGARCSEQNGADDARQGRRQHDALDRLGLGGAEAVGAVAQGLRHGVDDVVGQRGDERDEHHAHDEARRQHAGRRDAEPDRGAKVADERPEGDEREEAVDDGRDAGQDFQQRLDDRAHVPAGVLRHVDRREQSDRNGNRAGRRWKCSRCPTAAGSRPNWPSAPPPGPPPRSAGPRRCRRRSPAARRG